MHRVCNLIFIKLYKLTDLCICYKFQLAVPAKKVLDNKMRHTDCPIRVLLFPVPQYGTLKTVLLKHHHYLHVLWSDGLRNLSSDFIKTSLEIRIRYVWHKFWAWIGPRNMYLFVRLPFISRMWLRPHSPRSSNWQLSCFPVSHVTCFTGCTTFWYSTIWSVEILSCHEKKCGSKWLFFRSFSFKTGCTIDM